MPATKADIIAQLRRDILPLQGFKSTINNVAIDVDLGPLMYSFPNAVFPLSAVHEFICDGAEDTAATSGFITGILNSLMRCNGVSLWIRSSQTLFPPAFKSFGVNPDKIIFVTLQRERDILWAMEEALKCHGLSAVVGEIQELNFTTSRRFQIAVEQSCVTGFIIRNKPRNLNTTACVTRWKVTSLPSASSDDIPGVGFPCWNIELLRARNGKPGIWQIECAANRFRHISRIAEMHQEEQKRTG